MRQSLVNLAVLTVVGCLLNCLAYPGYGQEMPAGPAQSLLEEASEQLGYGEYQAAAVACEQVIASYPEHEYDARLLLAEVYYVQGQFAQALEQADLALAKATGLYPDDSQRIAAAQAELDRLRQAQQNFTARVGELNQTISAYPGTPQAAVAQLQLADTLLMYGRRQQALAEYEKVIDEYPGTAEAVRAASRLVMVYEMSGDEASARAAYARAHSIRRGRQFIALGRPRIAEYQEVIEEQPGSAAAVDAQYRIGCIYALYAEYDQAIAQLTNLIEQYPESAEAVKAFNMLQAIFGHPDRQQEALRVLPELVNSHYSDSPQMLLKLCQFYKVQGKLGQAVPLAQTIAASFPQSIEAPKALLIAAAGYENVGRWDYAQAAAEAAGAKLRALAVEHPDTKVATTAGEIIGKAATAYYEEAFGSANEGQYEQAIAQFDQALALRPPGEIAVKAAYQKAICHYALGQEGAAIAAFQNVIEEHADNYLSVRAQGWIERIKE